MEVRAPYNNTFMLAIDHSPNSQYAFDELCKMINKERDLIYLITVAEYIPFYGPAMSAVVITEAQKCAEARAESLLAEYVHKCRAAGIKNYKSLLGRGGHIGEVICRAAEEKNVNNLLIGRRGMGKIKRIFIGSVSRYCVEHAPCSVLCVKMPVGHHPAPAQIVVPQHHIVQDSHHKAEAHEAKYQSQGVSTNHELFTIQED